MRVLVVGAGIAGLCLARELALRGCAVTVISDGGSPGASQAAVGLLQIAGGRISQHHLLLRRACWEFYPAFAASLGVEILEAGHLRLGDSASSLKSFAATLRGLGREARFFPDAGAVDPGCSGPGVWLPDATVRIPELFIALEKGLLPVVARAEARLVGRTADGWTSSCGKTWKSDVTVLACGAALEALWPFSFPFRLSPGWTATFEGSVQVRHSVEYAGETVAALGSGWRVGGLPEEGAPRISARIRCEGRELERVEGTRISAPDGLPLVGALDEDVFVLGGLGRNGLLTAPLLASGLAERIVDGKTPEWLQPFAPDRAGVERRRAWSR